MTLRPTDEQTERLRKAAAREHTSMHAIALKAIDEYTTKHTRRRDEIIARVLEEDAGLLKRLADS